MIAFAHDFLGIKISTNDKETNKLVSALAKQHKMFLLCSHSGVKYYITTETSDYKAFKKSISELPQKY